jgi:N-hydroxyarylamine O-acetyltransferase
VPFENLDVLAGRPPRLDLDSLAAKLVAARRGGYCYEHATLFAAVLDRLGFAPATHSARVIMVTPKSSAPRTHMFLTVGDAVIDPGFGGITPWVPVPLDGTRVRSGCFEHWIVRDGADWILMAHAPDRGEVRAWTSSLERDFPIDFEMANHYTATHPNSPFTQRLMLRAFTPDGGRITVMNRDVTRFTADGVVAETWRLADRAALVDVLATSFGTSFDATSLRVPSIHDWDGHGAAPSSSST